MTQRWDSMSPPAQLVLRLTAGLVIVGALLYVITTIKTTQADAFDIATGTVSPYFLKAGIFGVLLAVVGYLLVPALAGAILAAVVDAKGRDRAPTAEAVAKELTPQIAEAVERLAKQELDKRAANAKGRPAL